MLSLEANYSWKSFTIYILRETRRKTDIYRKIYNCQVKLESTTIFVDNSLVVQIEGFQCSNEVCCSIIHKIHFEYEVLCKANLVNYGPVPCSYFECFNYDDTRCRSMHGQRIRRIRRLLSPPQSVKHARRSPQPKEPFTRRLRAGFSRRLSCQISIYADY